MQTVFGHIKSDGDRLFYDLRVGDVLDKFIGIVRHRILISAAGERRARTERNQHSHPY